MLLGCHFHLVHNGIMESNVSVANIYPAYSSLDPYKQEYLIVYLKLATTKMACWRLILACLILVLYSVSSYECRLLSPKIEVGNPVPTRMLSLVTSSGKLYNVEITDDKNLYESKRLSPGGPDPKHHWLPNH